ncbi:MAG: hypothetical protein WCD18_11520, partial [Thermosynechococcaceae cyanobacterium]
HEIDVYQSFGYGENSQIENPFVFYEDRLQKTDVIAIKMGAHQSWAMGFIEPTTKKYYCFLAEQIGVGL